MKNKLFCFHKYRDSEYVKGTTENIESGDISLVIIQTCVKCGKEREAGILLVRPKEWEEMKKTMSRIK